MLFWKIEIDGKREYQMEKSSGGRKRNKSGMKLHQITVLFTHKLCSQFSNGNSFSKGEVKCMKMKMRRRRRREPVMSGCKSLSFCLGTNTETKE